METEDEVTDPTKRYIRREAIGSGAFKVVYRGFDTEEGREVAWNEINVTKLSESSTQKLSDEVTILSSISHNHIIEFLDCWLDEEANRFVFVTEILTSGNLREYIQKNSRLRVRNMRRWSKQILEGLVYLHSQVPPIIHRDIKCDNIFIEGSSSTVKIGDLGLSTLRLTKDKIMSVIGTPEFMAPELYSETYDERVDVYAFGMCVLEMATLEYPYMECENAAQIYKKVMDGQPPGALERIKVPAIKSFIEECISPASERMTSEELVNHKFLQPDDELDKLSIKDITIQVGQFGVFEGNHPKADASGLELKEPSPVRPIVEIKEEPGTKDQKSDPVGDGREEDIPLKKEESEDAKEQKDNEGVVGELHKDLQKEKALPSTPKVQIEAKKKSLGGMDSTPVVLLKDMKEMEKGASIDLVLSIPSKEGENVVVEFDFDLKVDTPDKVASEMILEVDLPPEQLSFISKSIKKAVQKSKVELERRKKEREQKSASIDVPRPASSNAPLHSSSSPRGVGIAQPVVPQSTSLPASPKIAGTKPRGPSKPQANGQTRVQPKTQPKTQPKLQPKTPQVKTQAKQQPLKGEQKNTQKAQPKKKKTQPQQSQTPMPKTKAKTQQPKLSIQSPESGASTSSTSPEKMRDSETTGNLEPPIKQRTLVDVAERKRKHSSELKNQKPLLYNLPMLEAEIESKLAVKSSPDDSPKPGRSLEAMFEDVTQSQSLLERLRDSEDLEQDDLELLEELMKKQTEERRKMEEKQAAESKAMLEVMEKKKQLKAAAAAATNAAKAPTKAAAVGRNGTYGGSSSEVNRPNTKAAGGAGNGKAGSTASQQLQVPKAEPGTGASTPRYQDDLDEKFLAQFESDFGVH